MKISCPKCKSPLLLDASTMGKIVVCPHCGQQMRATNQGGVPVVGSSTPPPLPPPPPPPAYVPPPPPAVAEQPVVTSLYRHRLSSRWQPSHSFFDVFDWKFEKFITPWVIRLTWILALGMATLFMVLILISTMFGGSLSNDYLSDLSRDESVVAVESSFDDTPHSSGLSTSLQPHILLVSANDDEDFAPSLLAQSRSASSNPSSAFFVLGMLFKLFTVVVFFLLNLLWLLWIRVFLECVVVIFNIATTLKATEDLTREIAASTAKPT